MQRGGGSKDTWVLSDGPVSSIVAARASRSRSGSSRRRRELPSRVAENLFWLGRYVERAEHLVRLLRSFVARLADQDTTDDPREVAALLQLLVDLRAAARGARPRHVPLRELEEDTIDLISSRARTPACATR